MVAIEHTGGSEQVRKRGLPPLVQSKQRRGQAPLPDLFLNRHVRLRPHAKKAIMWPCQRLVILKRHRIRMPLSLSCASLSAMVSHGNTVTRDWRKTIL